MVAAEVAKMLAIFEDRGHSITWLIECDVCVVSGEEKERLKDASKVKAQPTERIESPSTEIGRKAAVGREL